MKMKKRHLEHLIQGYLFESDEEKERKDPMPTEIKIQDSKGTEHSIRFNQEKKGVYQLYINDQHYKPQGIEASDKINNAFLAISGLVLKQHADKEEIVKKMIGIIKSIDGNLSQKSDTNIMQTILNKQRGGRLPYSLTDELLNRDKI